jgi:predicted kinase
MPTPHCIIITGRPGSGKSTLARELGRLVHLPVISRDELKEGFVMSAGVRHEELPGETNRVVTDTFFRVTRELLVSGVSVIVEAAFQHKLWDEAVPGWLEISRARIIICDLDPQTCAERHLRRGLEDPARELFHGDPRVKTYRETGQILPPGDWNPPEFPCPTLRVRTEAEYDPSLEALKDWLDFPLFRRAE